MNNELRHHGVKGMKWGVRKDRKSGKLERQIKRHPSRAFRKASKKANKIQKEIDKNWESRKRVGSYAAKTYQESILGDGPDGRKIVDVEKYNTSMRALGLLYQEIDKGNSLESAKKAHLESMKRNFANTSINDIKPKDREIGKEYIKYLKG